MNTPATRMMLLMGFACAVVAAGARADTIVLNDGSKVEGTIIEEKDGSVVIKVKFGQVSYSKAEIKEIKRTAPPAGSAAPGGSAAPRTAAPKRGDTGLPTDVLVLKSGAEHRGLLVSEDAKAVVFDLVMGGSAVSKIMLTRTSFERAEVVDIRKLTDSQRAETRKELEKIDEMAAKDAVAEQQLPVTQETVPLPGKDASKTITLRKVDLEHFAILSNAEEDFLRKAAFRLGKVFSAYKQHFGAAGSQNAKVKVIIFNSMAEYYAALGNTIKNPAFYSPDKKLICAGCDVAAYKEVIAAIRKDHDRLDSALREWRRKLNDARQQVAAQVGKAYDHTKRTGDRRALDSATDAQRRWQIEVGQMEKQVTEIQNEVAALNRRNDMAFNDYTKRLFATLYHEGFHAFADNFLFPEGKMMEVPRWLNEGLAQYFECARIEGDRLILGQEDRGKMAFLRKCKRDGGLVPLDKMMTGGPAEYMIVDMADVERSTKHYLQAWAMTHLLAERGRLTKETLDDYAKLIQQQKPPLEALAKLAGMAQADMDAAWTAKLEPGFDANK
jgi:hypothetical protein